MSKHVRDAVDATVDDLTPAERVAVARFADLVDLRRDRPATSSPPSPLTRRPGWSSSTWTTPPASPPYPATRRTPRTWGSTSGAPF
ncbi:hypothetical protein ACIBUR_23570 [Streptomyces anulatus]